MVLLKKDMDLVKYAHNFGNFSKIMDTVGDKVFSESLKILKPYGAIVTINSNANTSNLGEFSARNFTIHYVMMLLPVLEKLRPTMKHQGQILEEIKKLVEKEVVKPQLRKTFSLKDVGRSHSLLESGGMIGKCCLKV